MKMTKDELQLIIDILVKEHDSYYEMLLNDNNLCSEDFKEEGILRKFLLQAEKQGYKLNGLYPMTQKIEELDKRFLTVKD